MRSASPARYQVNKKEKVKVFDPPGESRLDTKLANVFRFASLTIGAGQKEEERGVVWTDRERCNQNLVTNDFGQQPASRND